MAMTRIFSIAIAAALVATFAVQAVAAPIVVFADDFESYTSGAVLPTTGPWDAVTFGNANGSYTWGRQVSVRDSNNVYPGDGSRVVPTSPFGTGSQMLEFWDESSDHRHLVAQAGFSVPMEGQYPMTVSLDYRIDDISSNFNGEWRLSINDADGGSANGYQIGLLRGSDPDALEFGFFDTSNSFQSVLTLTRGTWYRAEFSFDTPSGSANQPATVKFWQWDDGEAEATFLDTFNITARQGLTQINRLTISDTTPSGRGHFYVDNITVSVVPEPGTLLLIGSGLAGLYGIRRRRQV